MWNFVNTMGHPGHVMSPQKRDFSMHLQSVPIAPGKAFTNPNFVNKRHPSVHSYQNQFILTPIQKISHSDSGDDVDNTPHRTNSALVNSSQSIMDKVKENHIDVETEEPVCEIVKEPLTCNNRKRHNRHSSNNHRRQPGKSHNLKINRQEMKEMMETDLEMEPSISVSLDISTSPKKASNSFDLTDFIVAKPCKTKLMKIEQNHWESDEEEVFTEIPFSPSNGRLCMRERQISLTESEDSFIVFESGSDEESEFSDEESDDESEEEKDDVDSSSLVIPRKRVRFADDSELCEIHPMIQWSFAYQQARKGPWEEYARDRDRFSQRIARVEKIISPVFDAKHRENVYRDRFGDTNLSLLT